MEKIKEKLKAYKIKMAEEVEIKSAKVQATVIE